MLNPNQKKKSKFSRSNSGTTAGSKRGFLLSGSMSDSDILSQDSDNEFLDYKFMKKSDLSHFLFMEDVEDKQSYGKLIEMILNEEGGYMESSLYRHYFHIKKTADDEYEQTKIDLMFECPHNDREIFGKSQYDHMNLCAMLQTLGMPTMLIIAMLNNEQMGGTFSINNPSQFNLIFFNND